MPERRWKRPARDGPCQRLPQRNTRWSQVRCRSRNPPLSALQLTVTLPSWNKELTNKRGAAMGAEFRRKGVNVLLGPVVGPAWRVVKGGRNWEGFSADPYLAGSLVAQGVEGIQAQRVITSTKASPKSQTMASIADRKQHYIANEQETNRVPEDGVAAVSSNVDDRTMHEHYLWYVLIG